MNTLPPPDNPIDTGIDSAEIKAPRLISLLEKDEARRIAAERAERSVFGRMKKFAQHIQSLLQGNK